MSKRNIRLIKFEGVEPCPECGNRSEFTVYSQQVAEDCCDIWAECKCGFDPTKENTGYRVEDVWGGVGDDNCVDAINIAWNESIRTVG